jgi:hypothetical protein
MSIDIEETINKLHRVLNKLRNGSKVDTNLFIQHSINALEQQQAEVKARDEVIQEFINLIPRRKRFTLTEPYDVLEIALVFKAEELLNIKGES